MIYIGGEVVISPLGEDTATNWNALLENRSGISRMLHAGFAGENLFLSKMDFHAENRFLHLVMDAIAQVSGQIDAGILRSDRTIVIISSTKGALDCDPLDQFGGTIVHAASRFQLANLPLVISNACISGVLSVNAAGSFIETGVYDHAVIVGCDVISGFIINGFQSLFAVSDKPCMPFDADRKGITLGEGCGAVVVSREPAIFKKQPLQLLKGTSANDANHISGPSRTGEGLFRSVSKTLGQHGIAPQEIDFVCAHGTATVFNDEMESIAFDRSGLRDAPLNSLKGYFGHTLGAAGVIETAVCMQMMRNTTLLKSAGFEKPGTSKALNVVTANTKKHLKTILKTASGFGGGNASLIIKSL